MNLRVLIADGDETLQAIFSRCFSRRQFDADAVGTGLECVQRLRTGRYQALVLSRELLWGSADGVLAVMREEPDLSEIPVVLISTLVSSEELSNLVLPPVVEVLRKPFSLASLVDSVRTAAGAARAKLAAAWNAGSASCSLVTS